MGTDSFHLFEGRRGSYGGRSLLNDLLVPPLDGAVPAKQRDGVSVFISKNLNLEVPGVLSQLHDKDRRAGNLCLNLHSKNTHEQLSVNSGTKVTSRFVAVKTKAHIHGIMSHINQQDQRSK